MITLYPHQSHNAVRLAQILRERGAAADLSDTGTGKTFTALEVARQLQQVPLIVTPKSVVTSFRRAAAEYGTSVADVLNVEQLKTGRTGHVAKDRDGKFFWTIPPESLVILDEAHRFGGITSQNSWLLAVSKAQKIKMLLLSATLADSPLKLRATGFLFGLHSYNLPSYYSWCKAHGCRKAFMHAGLLFPKGPARLAHLERIHAQLAPYCVRTRIADIPGFPECTTQALLFDLQQKYTDEINAIYEEMREEIRKPRPSAPELVLLMRARQRVEMIKVPLLEDLVLEALEEGRSVVVFHNFRDALEDLYERLRGAVGVSRIVGGEEGRQEQVDAFQADENHVCLAMSQAGGVGLSLHDVRGERPRTALLTPNWDAVVMKQCLGRIWRAGAQSKALQQFVLAANTIEERVHAALQGKLLNLATINGEDLV